MKKISWKQNEIKVLKLKNYKKTTILINEDKMERGVTMACPKCGSNKGTINNLKKVRCGNCGHVYQR